jgi:hypothetical protein
MSSGAANTYAWGGGPNQGQRHRDTFGGNYLGTPHNVPGIMLPSHAGLHQKGGRMLADGFGMKNGESPLSSIPQNARVPGFPNFASARGTTLKYTPPP